jgi:hypothetical protein
VNSYTYKRRLLLGGYTLLLFFTGAKADTPDTMASVHGTVTNAATGGGLRKAYILLSRVRGSGPSYSAVANDQGTFTIESIAPGVFRLSAERTGFLDADAGVELQLSARQKLTGIDFKLMPQAVLSGRVLDQDGDPWPHAQSVQLYHSVWKKGRRHIESAADTYGLDERGEFRISALPPGRYYVLAEPDPEWEKQHHPEADNLAAILEQPTWYPASPDVESSTPITLTAGQQLDGIEIRLRRGAGSDLRIRGKLEGIQEIPAPLGDPRWAGRQIWARRISSLGMDGESRGGSIQADGSFQIERVSSGDYDIWVGQGFPRTVLGRATVQVGNHDVENVSIELHPLQTLDVTVRIEGDEVVKPPGVAIALESVDDPGIDPYPNPKDDGGFKFDGLGLGRYGIYVQEPAPKRVYLKLIRYGNAESHDGAFTLASYGVPLELVFSTLGARLSGTVTGKATTPRVVLIPDTPDAARREYETRIGVFDQKGAFTIESIPPGSYKLYAFENVPDQIWLDPDFLKEVETSGVAFEAADGDAKSVQIPLLLKAETDRVLAKLGIE